MARKIARIVCVIVTSGVILLCVVHAAVQLVTGGSLDHGDWIGIILFAAVLMALLHMKRFHKKPPAGSER